MAGGGEEGGGESQTDSFIYLLNHSTDFQKSKCVRFICYHIFVSEREKCSKNSHSMEEWEKKSDPVQIMGVDGKYLKEFAFVRTTKIKNTAGVNKKNGIHR